MTEADECPASVKHPSASPAASTSPIVERTVTVKGPKGTLSRDHPGRDHRAPGRRHAARRAPRRRAREPLAARPHPLARQQHGRRRDRRASPRSSRSSASATAPRPRVPPRIELRARLQPPGGRRGARRHHVRGARADAHRRDGHRQGDVGQVAANIRSIRKPEPYKGKGVQLRRREGPAQGRKDRARSDAWRTCQRSAASRALRRHGRVRKKIHGTAERPRLAVFRSNKHLVLQVIDDESGRTLAAASTNEAEQRATRWRRARSTAPTRVGSSSPSGPRPPASRRSSSTVVGSSTTVASLRRPMPPVKQVWSSDGCLTRSHHAARVARHRHQPRRQGRQGWSPVLVHRARGDRRRQRPRRPRLRQGQGGAAGDPEGHRGGEEEPVRGRRSPAPPSPTRCSA